jgi:plasmid stabilization system protein ParE
MGKRVIWSPTALRQLEEARSDVLETSKSIKSANRLARDNFESTDGLFDQPEMYPLDRNKAENDTR